MTAPRPSNRARLAKGGGALVVAGAAILAGMHQWEKQVLHVYPDKLAGNLPTFCSGRTDWKMPIGKTFTREECDVIDAKTATEYGEAILGCTAPGVLTQDAFDALTLFAVNVGKEGACGSRAVRLINQGRLEEGCVAMARGPNGELVWSYASGKFVRGLANRRAFENNWCLSKIRPEVMR